MGSFLKGVAILGAAILIVYFVDFMVRGHFEEAKSGQPNIWPYEGVVLTLVLVACVLQHVKGVANTFRSTERNHESTLGRDIALLLVALGGSGAIYIGFVYLLTRVQQH
jgi:hypothetical protein